MAEQDLPILQAGPALALRKERVPVPELGGSVIVVGLLASEAFALEAIKQQATRRALVELSEERANGAEPGAVAAAMDFEDWRQYGRYVPELLARAVKGKGDLALYTADEWELMGQHHAGVIERLQAVAERLSGLNGREREKNSAGQS